MSSTFLSSN